MKQPPLPFLLPALLVSASLSHAQTLPDAGSVREQTQNVAPSLPRPVELRLDGQPLPPVEEGGMRFRLEAVDIEGNTVITTDELQALIAGDVGKEVDFGGLRAIANKISQFYRDRGYIFAKAALPAQDIVGGKVKLLVLEGKLGKVEATLDGQASEVLQAYLGDLKTGDVIESDKVERAALLLADLPGYNVVPVVRPSETVGAGDLEVIAKESAQYEGSLRADNHGGELTGANRLLLSLARNRNMVVGDRLQVDALASEGGTGLFNLQYSLPLGTDGWRGTLGWSHSTYKLSDLAGFEDGEFKGGSDVLSLGLSYPLVRSQRVNLTFSAGLNLSSFTNTRPAVDDEQYESTTLPLSLRFNRMDNIGGGGINFGMVSLTTGRIKAKANYLSPATEGSFSKFGLDVARVQNLPGSFTLYGRLNAQHASDALDSSERMSAGGASGVRAFPSGEASGDRGTLAQMELRYQSPLAGLQPYVFADTASMTRLDKEAGNTTRRISGHGVGIRWQRANFSADLAAAWVGRSGLDDDAAAKALKEPRYWLSLNLAF